MRFFLIDKIEELVPGKKLVATKNLSLAEEYLREHFPLTPIMPGVLMMEAMTQAAAWLIRASEGFRHSLVLLKEANNVKYGKFVEPGDSLRIEAQILREEGCLTTVKVTASVQDRVAVSARLTLARSNLADTQPELAEIDQKILQEVRNWFRLLLPRGIHS
jgi:3-hydroxymyristoyl/3-hydroxydecanoyl-(acyl carrier protein) dehydratases